MLLPPLLRRRTELLAAAHAACGGGALSDAALETLCDWEVLRALLSHYLLTHAFYSLLDLPLDTSYLLKPTTTYR